jgi:hypothetical protein
MASNEIRRVNQWSGIAMAIDKEALEHLIRTGRSRGRGPEHELYEEAGRAVITLSEIEGRLGECCVYLSGKAKKEAAQFFDDLGTLEKRIRFTKYVVSCTGDLAVIKDWVELLTEIQSHKGIRNLVAHQSLIWGLDIENGLPPAYLAPRPTRRGSSRVKMLGIREIRATADALKRIAERIAKMLAQLPPSH